MMKRFFSIAQLFVLMAGLSVFLMACSAKKVEVHQPWARAAMKGENSAVYFVLHNHSNQPDELIGASCDCAQVVELHQTVMEGDVMKMQPVASIPLASGEEVTFQPGGLHVMLISLSRDLKEGEQINLVLKFKRSGELSVKVPVKQAGSEEGEEHDHQHTP